jgi:hypothetical protein
MIIIILNELWFEFIVNYECIWFAQGTSSFEMERLIISNINHMIIIIWNFTYCCQITVFSKGSKFNPNYYISEIVIPCIIWYVDQLDVINQKLILNSDNDKYHIINMINELLLTIKWWEWLTFHIQKISCHITLFKSGEIRKNTSKDNYLMIQIKYWRSLKRCVNWLGILFWRRFFMNEKSDQMFCNLW